jgi:uncharacterized protein YgbK (DUF1537 family)
MAIDPDGDREARRRIRAANLASGRRIAVLDDDPTGSQTVHGVQVVLVLDPAEYAQGLQAPGSTCFVLTNSRSLSEPDAARITRAAGRDLFALGERWDVPLSVISRSDSTLRGHLMAEVGALDSARREVTGRGHDGVLLVPSYFEAGRYTAGDTHWALVGGRPVPVGETEFARDAVFGYTASDLRDFVVEKSRGEIDRRDVRSLTLDDIRSGGPARVTQVLSQVSGGRFVVVNATGYADLEIVVLGLLEAERAGQAFLHRTGPSFVRVLAGLEPQPPLSGAQIWPQGRPAGHGLVVVGSHVGLTNRQLEVARGLGGLSEVRLDVPALVDPARRQGHVDEITGQVQAALARSDVLLLTSRDVVLGADRTGSLLVSRTVSGSVADVVRRALAAHPRWVIAKGGITSHDVAVQGLGIRRAVVVGQLLPGLVSVFRPVEAAPDAAGTMFVVFAGNVGDEHTLAKVIEVVRGVPEL